MRHKNDLIASALLQTAAGRKLVAEVKNHRNDIEARKAQVVELIRANFTRDVEFWARGVPETAKVIANGGEAYDHLVADLKYSAVDRRVGLRALGLMPKPVSAPKPIQMLSISESNLLC